jgi:phthalate 4,5-dioxygenase oxygenase subunit
MLTREENELLCRVEGDAPMGQLMRRHWIPICMSEEVLEPDGAPVRARLLGEDLVVFRDSDARLGVLGEYCTHRGASLALGRNEECGLRCLYHGWKFDVEGNVLEMCSEPAQSALVEKVKHKAYPAREAGGFVWIYMGPANEMREFQPPAWAPSPDTKISIVKMHVAANWAQTLEGGIDSAHSSSLHSTDMPPARVDGAKATATTWPRPSTDKAPRLQAQRTGFGFQYAAIRRPIMNASSHDYVRITVFIAPFTSLIPPNNVHNLSIMNIPLDDTNTFLYMIAWAEADKPGIEQEAWRKFCGAQVGIDLDAQFRKIRNRENNYLQDRKAMKLGDFTGIRGFPNQDIAMWETMGAIVDRTKERLGASDIAIVEFRRIMVDAARKIRDGGPAIGLSDPRIPHVKLRSFEGIVPKVTNWQMLGVAEEELAATAGGCSSAKSGERAT